MKTTARLLFALAATFAASAHAQPKTFTANPEASQVKMNLPGTGHATEGTFRVTKGSVHFETSPGPISGMIVVSAASGNTGNESRDKKMTSEVLEAGKFAEVTFAPESYKGTLAASGDSTIQVSGTFTLHGTAHPLTVPMQVHLEGGKMSAHTVFKVPYVQWGLKNPSIMILKVDKEVEIDLTLVGSVE